MTKSFFVKYNLRPKIPIFQKSRAKLKLWSIHNNLHCRKFSAVCLCPKIAILPENPVIGTTPLVSRVSMKAGKTNSSRVQLYCTKAVGLSDSLFS